MPDTTSELAAHGAQPAALMIDARDVRKRFGTHEVLRGVSLSVARGEVVAVIGPSGSGKSTFLRCLNHLETIDRGFIAIEGEALAQTDAAGNCTYVSESEVRRICRKTGMVFQHFNLFPHLTVLENLIEAPLVCAAWRVTKPSPARKCCWTKWACAPSATTTPRACRVGKSSAWRLRGHWPWSPTSCCSMSPPRHLTQN